MIFIRKNKLLLSSLRRREPISHLLHCTVPRKYKTAQTCSAFVSCVSFFFHLLRRPVSLVVTTFSTTRHIISRIFSTVRMLVFSLRYIVHIILIRTLRKLWLVVLATPKCFFSAFEHYWRHCSPI